MKQIVIEETNTPNRVADIVIDTLINLNVTHFFGVPGGPVSPIFHAAWKHPKVRLIESRQETNAAFTAMGYHRTRGNVPCVIITAGPGATNAITGVTAASTERTPMIIIAGDVSWEASGKRLLQDSGPQGIDMENMFRGVTRAVIRIRQAKSASAHIIEALQIANNPKNPGPVLVIISIDKASEKTTSPTIVVTPIIEMNDHGVDMELVKLIRDRLIKAERPLLVFGAGCRPFWHHLECLLFEFKIPFITTPRAKGIVNETHSCSLGHGGLAARAWAREYTRRGVDFALIIGTDLDDCSIGSTSYIKDGGELVHIDCNALVFNRNLPTSMGIIADIGVFLNQLIIAVQDIEVSLKPEVEEIKNRSPFDHQDFKDDESTIITPYRALADLQRACPDARFVTDIGEHMLFALHYLVTTKPDEFTIHLGLGSMGSGICSSIGLAIGDRSSKVVCICGDGGMQMSGMELMVARMQKLPILFAVFNDSRYNMVYHGFNQVYGENIPVETPLIDFRNWGVSMGINAERIDHPGEITNELVDRLTKDGPAILDIRIDREKRVVGGGRNEALKQMSEPVE
jgi:acetolactate synthase-1/2/3 large subunit